MPAHATSSTVDITRRGDVHDLVVGFYREIVFDEFQCRFQHNDNVEKIVLDRL